ncbi:MAG TPA: serine hydrolase [Prolixibacteraceae bacterium]|nr:serine hydrolase [Prolixibacteraceae bacterium]
MRGKRLSVTVFFLSLYFILSVPAGNTFHGSISASEDGRITEKDTVGPYPLTLCSPLEVGMNPVKLSRIDSIVMAGIRAQVFPGCQVLVMKEGKAVYDKCFGNYTYADSLKVQPTTMYDLASLSKTTGTLIALMKLYDNGQLRLTDKASRYLSFLKGTDKEKIIIKELLVHESGLPAYIPFYQMIVEKSGKSSNKVSAEMSTLSVSNKNRIPGSSLQYKEGMVAGSLSADYRYQVSDSVFVSNRLHEAAMQSIARAKLGAKIYNYSCVNFMLLKEVVETISGMPMDEFLDREFYRPMQLNHMAYLPLRKYKREQLAPTLKMDVIRRQAIQGYVHDMDAALLGGVSGNAGLFASAGDVAMVYQMLLNGGELNGRRYLGAETCRIFTTTTSASGRRGLGFDKPVQGKSKSSPCCDSAPKAVYGHTGYTGTCCWVDPENQLVYVFLSNRTFPYDGVNKLAKTGIRTKIQDVIYQSMKN